MFTIRRCAVAVAATVCFAAAPEALANGVVVHPGETAPRGGGRPVVLESNRVVANVEGRVADVTVEQTFRNRSNVPVEGVYLFPLPEGAVVSRFAMTMGGRLVEGQVIEAKEARAVYESIVRRSRDPGLLEYAGRGLYRANVFPIEPRGKVLVRLSFQQVLPEDQGTLEWRFPLATQRLNGEPVATVTVEVAVAASYADLKAVYSPSHAVSVTRDGERRARIAWGRERAVQDRDFLLYLGRSQDTVGFALVSTKPASEDGTFFAVLAPKTTVAEKDRAPKDVVFVLDTSGSMENGKLEQAKKAVAMGIATLRPVDRFNVIGFSTSVVPFRGSPVFAEREHRAAARAWLDGLVPTGGTNIEGALSAALSTNSLGRLLLVVFVTDGLPTVGESDPDAIVRRALASNPSKARVFTFGVGTDLDVGLLDRIAEGTGGTRDYVAGTEDLELATGRFYAKVAEPVLTDVKVDLGPDAYDVYPQRVPDLFAGQQVVLFGRYKTAGARTLRVTGTVAGKPVVFEASGTLRDAAGPAYLPRLWAQRKVAFLLDAIRLNGEAKELVDEVVRLATRHAIVTPYTSGLVVEDEEIHGLRGTTAAPLGGLGGRSRWRGPGGSIPPGLSPPTGPPPPTTAPSDPSVPTTVPPPTSPAAAGGGIAQSKELRRRKEAASAEESAPGDGVKTVGARTFARKPDGRWADTAWDGTVATTQVVAWSQAYLDLLGKSDELARILALGDAVVFLWEGKVIEVVPAAETAPR